jgi:arylsulfatase A-like enzyme
MKLKITLFLSLKFLLLGVVFTGAAFSQMPNVVLVITDDQDFAGVGAYENLAYTPRIDRLAAEGMRFNHAHITSSACSPSRYSIFTGRLASRGSGEAFQRFNPPGAPAYITNDAIDLERDRPNFVGVLQDAGYRTGFFGKWHLGPHAIEKLGARVIARDRKLGEPEVDATLRDNHRRYAEYIAQFGFDTVDRVYWNNVGEWNIHVDGLDAQNMEWKIEGALDFMDAAKEDERPFLLWFAMVQPHNGSAGVQRYSPLVGSELITPIGMLDEAPDVMPARETLAPRVKESGVPWDLPRKRSAQHEGNDYSLWIDDGVGAILDKLDELGVADNTIVIFISDNPTWGKFHTYERGTLVPMIVRWPGKVPAGTVNENLFANTDFAATLLAAAGLEMPSDLGQDSINQLPSLLHNQVARQINVTEFGSSRSVSDGKWKYIALRPTPADVAFGERLGLPVGHWGEREGEARYKMLATGWRAANLRFFPNYFDADQLYDLETDPMEQVNLANDPAARHHLERMKALMNEITASVGRPFGEFGQ